MNELMEKGLKAGGIEPNELRDNDFLQQRTIEDFDGHTWELFYTDWSKFPLAPLVE
jgi:predicted lactoylglutathione lyase